MPRHDYSAALWADVEHIYKRGVGGEADPSRIPALAELALATGEKTNPDLGLAVQTVVTEGVAGMRGDLRSKARPLLGLDGRRDHRGRIVRQTLTNRREAAASAFIGEHGDWFKDGETLRQAFIARPGLLNNVLRELHRSLLAFGDASMFVYLAKYEYVPDSVVPAPGPSPSRRGRGIFYPARPVYDFNKYDGNDDPSDPYNPAAHYGRLGAIDRGPVFNSYINFPLCADERSFFTGFWASDDPDRHRDPIESVTDARVITARVYVHNMAMRNARFPGYTTANGAFVRVFVPPVAGQFLRMRAYIGALDADPTIVENTLDLSAHQPFRLAYVPGSAFLARDHRHYPLGDEIVGEGALIGDRVMNGELPTYDQFETVALVFLDVRVIPE